MVGEKSQHYTTVRAMIEYEVILLSKLILYKHFWIFMKIGLSMFFESALILIIKDVSIMPKKCHNLYQYTFSKQNNTLKIKRQRN